MTVSKLTKAPLIELCKAAAAIGLSIDPDGLTEDREEVIKDKVTVVGHIWFRKSVKLHTYHVVSLHVS